MPHALIIWLIAAVVLIIIEACTTNLVTIWIAIGAVVAAIVAAFNLWPIVQWGAFVFVSGVLLIVTRPLAKKFVPKTVPLNFDRVIGEVGVVIEEIEPTSGKGQIKVMGQIWSAKCVSGTVIPVDADVKVVEVEGVKVLVERV
ncbi:MAG: NfeD family protein [Oscillospiraceae bacterium]|nr:NfeD family protein [Oscillospiraceae bacterium]